MADLTREMAYEILAKAFAITAIQEVGTIRASQKIGDQLNMLLEKAGFKRDEPEVEIMMEGILCETLDDFKYIIKTRGEKKRRSKRRK